MSSRHNDAHALAADIAAIAAGYPQLAFALSNPDAPGTIYVSDNPKDNAKLTLQITATKDAVLTAGRPVQVDECASVTNSLIYLDLSKLELSDAELGNINTTNGWEALPDTKYSTICLAPTSASVAIKAGAEGITIGLAGLAMKAMPSDQTPTLKGSCYHIDGIASGSAPSKTEFLVTLMCPPDAPARDLHDDLRVTVTPTQVVCSVDAWEPVANTLTVAISTEPHIKAGPESVFEVHFTYDGLPGWGALCPTPSPEEFALVAGPETHQNWDKPEFVPGEAPFIRLTPQNGQPLVGDDRAANFSIGNIVTKLEPGPTVVLVKYAKIPGYKDGSFWITLVKMPHVDITSLDVIPNPAVMPNPAGFENGDPSVGVTVKWVAKDAGALMLSWADGKQDVTGLSFYPAERHPPLTLTRTTSITLDADGISAPLLDNKATKSRPAVVIPYTNLKNVDLLPDGASLQFGWDIYFAEYAKIDGIDDKFFPPSDVTTVKPSASAITIHALDSDRKEIGSATFRRCWTVGSIVPVGSGSIYNGQCVDTITLSPDGERLYASSKEGTSAFELATLAMVKQFLPPFEQFLSTTRMWPAMACSFDSKTISIPAWMDISDPRWPGVCIPYAVDTQSYAGVELSWYMTYTQPPIFAARGNYLFMIGMASPLPVYNPQSNSYSLNVLDVKSNNIVMTDGVMRVPGQENNPPPQFMALTDKRFYYRIEEGMRTLDCETLSVVDTSPVDVTCVEQLSVLPDDSRAFVSRPDGATVFLGPGWTNPAPLPRLRGARCRGVVANRDGTQAFVLWDGMGNDANNQIQVLDFDADTQSYVPTASLPLGAGKPVEIAVASDAMRFFVNVIDAGNNVSIRQYCASWVKQPDKQPDFFGVVMLSDGSLKGSD